MKDYWGNEKWNSFSSRSPKDLNGISILVLVGSLSISGGTNLILNYSFALQKAGAKVTVAYLQGKKEDGTWHPFFSKLQIREVTDVKKSQFDLGIATWWKTVMPLLEINCSRFVYFVQSMESRFALNYDDKRQEVEAAFTYTLGLQIITIASWLSNTLIAATQRPIFTVLNGVDKKIFQISNTEPSSISSEKLRVLVEGPLHVPMKAVDETLDLCISVPGIEVWHVSPERSGGSRKAHKKFENVPLTGMPNIYSQVDVLVKLSRVEGMFGPPLEAFHSGATAIVTKVTGSDEYIKHGVNALEVDVDDFESAREHLALLVEDRGYLQQLKKGAIETAKNWPSSEETASQFVSACHATMSSATLGVVNVKEAIFEHEKLLNRLRSNEAVFIDWPHLLVRD